MKFGFSTLICCFLFSLSATARQPNVLLIVSDDMGWSDIGYVSQTVKTPNLDRLAEEGVRLERFYANPLCSVTRAALMTGRASLVTGVSNRRGLPLHYPIMAEYFHQSGYATWMVGKWHLGGSRSNEFSSPEYLAHNRGFDHFYGHLNGALHYINHTVGSADGLRDWWRNGEPVDEEGFQTELLTNEAIHLVKTRGDDKPFFLYLAYHAPHTPLSPTPTGMELYEDIKDPEQRLLYANITYMDDQIGRLIDVLKVRGELENTLVLFFNDNGGSPRAGSSNLPLNGSKGNVYEGGIRVRAFARWPEKLPSHVINYQFMSVMDLFPTLASAASIKLPDTLTLDGVDLWDSIVRNRETDRPDFIMGNADIAVFRPPWKLIIPPSGENLQLFDVVEDPYEKQDMVTAKPDIAKELLAEGREMIARAEVPP
ncbi:MAG: arylsulfatase, partial [Verrucomicrobiae bacterium]|nr:arylsulfatase [Verrucomicrobiae bacterium]